MRFWRFPAGQTGAGQGQAGRLGPCVLWNVGALPCLLSKVISPLVRVLASNSVDPNPGLRSRGVGDKAFPDTGFLVGERIALGLQSVTCNAIPGELSLSNNLLGEWE